jgi:undecaprenyl diphosphate synthase
LNILQPLSLTRPPRHIAIIMDGNGRWAAERGLPRSAGHKQGVEALRRTVKAAGDAGVEILTVYSFSTENWSRPKPEVTFLLELFRRFVRQDVAELHAAGVRICMIGTREGLDRNILALVNDAEKLTAHNTGMTLVIAFNYGGRQELVRAMQAMAEKIAGGTLAPHDLSPECVSDHLDTAQWPDPDLLIRTGGEERISNFLLWQSAYTEFVFMPEYWPDFDGHLLDRAVAEFRGRERRFGGVKAKTA